MNIRYGLLHPAHLIITHNDKRLISKTVAEAEGYIQMIQVASRLRLRAEVQTIGLFFLSPLFCPPEVDTRYV